MKTITINTSCKKCERSSTYIKKFIKGKEYYVCSGCGFKLCPAEKIMEYAFPFEQKPLSNKARQYQQGNRSKSKKH